MSSKRVQVIKALQEIHYRTPPDERSRDAAKSNRVLQAALEIVLINGWRGLTIEGIAARAGVAKQTIYRWWPSKGAVLFDAVIADGFDWPPFPDTGDLSADLTTSIRTHASAFMEPPFGAFMRALLVGAEEDEVLARRLARVTTEAPIEPAARRFEAAKRTGQVDSEVNSEVLAEVAFGAILMRWLLGTGEIDAAFADSVAALAIRAAAPRAAAPKAGTS